MDKGTLIVNGIDYSNGGGSSGGSDVYWEQVVTEGEKIAEVTINEITTEVFAPKGGSGSSVDVAPVGTIISYMGNTPPANYLACDGSIYNISDYVKLANHINKEFGSFNYFGGDGIITFAVPDLRGEFLRGTGTNSHQYGGKGSSVGVHQAPTLIPYITPNVNGHLIYYDKPSITDFISNADEINKNATRGKAIQGSQWGTSTYNGNMATRPTNTSVLYCIKYDLEYIGLNDYSKEQVVGTWIDGKPIYRKMIEITPTSETYKTQTFPHNIANVENICRYEMFLVFSSGMVQPMPGAQFTSSGINVALTNFCDVSRTNIEVVFGYNRSSATVRVFIEYTKTTD